MSLFPVIASSVGTEIGVRIKNVTTLPIGEQHWTDVTLLVNGDDLVDHSLLANVCTITGSTNYNLQTKKYGVGSLYFPGDGNNFRIAANTTKLLGTNNNFTVEFWYYPIASKTNSCIIGNWDSNTYTGSQSWCITYDNNNRIRATLKSDDDVTIMSTGYTTLYPNEWHHVAFVRNGTSCTLFVDGQPTGSFIFTGSIAPGLSTTTINGYNNGYAYITGYLDELRITKNVARYRAQFFPPSTFPVAYGIDIINYLSPFILDDTYILYGEDQIYVSFIGMGKYPSTTRTPVPLNLFPLMFDGDSTLCFNLSSESFLQLGV